ncbi:MAG: 2'-deoxycytidine 5'-triphosphate deaminase [Alphaproteobacteria bacterium]|nr:2'-deoxycytidine 5'-triphosphate deaminase [Alphaproteobacteria bacterium]
MADAARPLFPDLPPVPAEDDSVGAARSTGILPIQAIRDLVATGEIAADAPIGADQLQPASLDLRLGAEAFRAPASFLPGPGATVREKIAEFAMHRLDISAGAVLEKGCVYIVPLLERVALGAKLAAFANPKSSTGRLDIFTRVITDQGTAFDRIDPGYKGPLYAEIAPRTFSVLVRQGSRLTQLRLRRGTPQMSTAALRKLQDKQRLVHTEPGKETIRDDMIGVTLDLQGAPTTGLVGYLARKHTGVIDVDRRAHYDPQEFWDPIHRRAGRGIILNPDDFYILATKEAVSVPPEFAAEMVPYDTNVGEFRVHYAGFFDPGFGWGTAGQGSRAVLEVRSHEVPFVLEHEQVVGWLRYEKLAAVPEQLYGQELGSNYQRQGLRLGKQFKQA